MYKKLSTARLDAKQVKRSSMKVEVQLVNEKGRSLPARERTSMPVYRGILSIQEARSHELGRITPTAQLVSGTDGTGLPLLPALSDAALLFLTQGQMRVRGFECVDGVQYGQTWDVRVA
jgi:acyl-CoA hydrolase